MTTDINTLTVDGNTVGGVFQDNTCKFEIKKVNNYLSSTKNNTLSPMNTNYYSNTTNMAVNNGYIEFYGGQDEYNSILQLYGRESSNFSGSFRILARNKDNTAYLYGTPDGALLWKDKPIIFIEESTANCIRYSNGIQECWGIFDSNDGAVTDVKFDLPFKDYNICTTTTEVGIDGADPYVGGFRVTGIYLSYMSIQNLTNGTNRCDWTAKGYWK